MKKLTSLIIILLIGLMFTGCPQGSDTWKTIKTVRVMLFSFDKNGIYPCLEEFNKNELGISVYADSLSETVEYAQSFSFIWVKHIKLKISSLSDVTHFFKFSTIPQNDSLQFEITGRITGENNFSEKTELVILN